MKAGTILFGVTLLLLAAAPTPAQQLPIDRIDRVFSEVDRTDRPGCSLAVFHDGETVYARGYGMSNLDYGIPLSPRSVFHIASVSKQFTAFAVDLLVADGSVSWDDDIRAYVPEIPDYGPTITLRHLVYHTSGIREEQHLLYMAGWRQEADLVTQHDAIDVMSRQRSLNFEPGDESLYTNSGFTLLAAVVERATGLSLREFTKQRIFDPLGMYSTHFHDDPETVVRDRAYGYRYDDEEGWKISIPNFANVGSSSLFTTVEDMARWNRNFRERKVGDETVFASFVTRGVLNSGDAINYAHGIFVSEYRGLATVAHSGTDAGYRSSFLRFPGQDVGIVCFCNFATANPSAYVRQVADIIMEHELAPVAEHTVLTDLDLNRWGPSFEIIAGFYRDSLTDIPLNIFVHNRQAHLSIGRARLESSQPLVPLGANQFRVGTQEDVVIVEMKNGHPTGLVYGEERYPFAGTTVAELDREQYLDIYWSDELGTEYRVEADTGDTGLLLTHRKQDPVHLRPGYRDAFFSGESWIVFHRERGKRVTGFSWSTGRVRRVRFTRRSQRIGAR